MPRTLSEAEYDAAKQKAIASLPKGLDEAGFQRLIGPAMEQALGEAENSPPMGEGSAAWRFLSGMGRNLNPVTAIKGVASAVVPEWVSGVPGTGLINTTKAIGVAQLEELKKAVDDFRQGHYSEMAGHGAAGLLPVIGPAAAAAGERAGSGDIAGGLGEGAGLLAPFGAAPVVRGARAVTSVAVKGARALGAGEKLDALAAMADRASTDRFTDVAGPKVGANKARFNRQAAEAAPQAVREPGMGAWSREGFQAKVDAKLAEATAGLDEASDSRLASQQVKTAPVVKQLDAEIAKLTAQPVEGTRLMREAAGPAVRDVPNDFMREYALKWMKQDMENLPFTKRSFNESPRGKGGDLQVSPGAAGAPIYRAIVGPEGQEVISATRGQVLKAIDDLLAGKTGGKLRDLVAGVADDLGNDRLRAQGLMKTSGPSGEGIPLSQWRDMAGEKKVGPPSLVGRPLGQAVEPAPNAAQIATLKQIRTEVASLGPVAPYEAVRRIRQAWDQVAKVKYLPSTAQDALKAQGEASAAMKGTGAMREALASSDPATAAANADYSLWKNMSDVLKANAEAERARPKVGRSMVARATGAMIGAKEGGVIGAGIGAAVAQMAERAVDLAPTLKIQIARRLASMADLLRSGNEAQAQQVVQRTWQLFPQPAGRYRFAPIVKSSVPLGRIVEGASLPRAAGDPEPPPGATGRR